MRKNAKGVDKLNGKKMVTPEQMLAEFELYVSDVKSKPFKITDWVGGMAMQVERKKERPLTIDGFEIHLYKRGICHYIRAYRENKADRYAEYVEVIDQITRVIRDDQISGGAVGIYNNSIIQRINGLTEKTDNKTEVTEIKVKYERKDNNS